jgi:hypothetical protein
MHISIKSQLQTILQLTCVLTLHTAIYKHSHRNPSKVIQQKAIIYVYHRKFLFNGKQFVNNQTIAA